MKDFRANHKRIVAIIRSLPDSDLITLGRYAWTGPSWTLSDYFRANTVAHYRWARVRIRRWWKGQSNRRPRKQSHR
jgi:hypothetical protein